MSSLMKQSTSYSQDQLKNLCDLVCDDIERLLQVLEVEDYRLTEKMVFCKCPIHDGDNESALNLYYTGESYRGNWKCRTHGCEETFRSSIIGFVRGVLSRQKYNWSSDGDKTVSFKDAVDFLLKFVNKELDNININKNVDSFTSVAKNFSKKKQENKLKLKIKS